MSAKKRWLSILLCFVMLIGLVPTSALAAGPKTEISEIELTATLPEKLYVGMDLYDANLIESIHFQRIKGAPARLDVGSPWMYYNENTGYYERIYQEDDERIVKAGVRYAYAAQVRIDGTDFETHTLADHVDVKVNGTLWNTTDDPYESQTVTYTWTQSPDFVVSGEPYRQQITYIGATVSGYQHTYFYGDAVALPTQYQITAGAPARFDGVTAVWQKKNGSTWEDCGESTFQGGTYRLKVKLVVDGAANNTHYLADGVYAAVNTTSSDRYWHAVGAPTHTADSSYVWLTSPEHVIQGPASYTVSFDANGGTGSMAAANNISGNYTLPPNGFTAPAGMEFKCWSVNSQEKAPFTSIPVTADVTVKAVWQPIVATGYTVSFDANGGTGSMAAVTNAPSSYTLPANGFTAPSGKQFKCWAVGVMNDEYDPGDTIPVTADLTVKAVWETLTSSRQVISDVVATSADLDSICTLYGLVRIPGFTVTQGTPAYITASEANLRWQKNIGGVWTDQDSGRFTPGEWRITTAVRIDGSNGYQYELGNPTTLTVNGQAWTVENGGKPSVHPSYSHAIVTSPTFTVVDDPNVQPPVPVTAVQMILKGYETGAPVSAATVETDAPVNVTLLGIEEGVDTNGDGVPDASVPAAGSFDENKMYAAVISMTAKPGYDIAWLTGDDVSLDRSILDGMEGFDPENETFLGMYLLSSSAMVTVSFETNGGSAISPVKVGKGSLVPPQADPVRPYYAFDGWYEDEALTKAFDPSTPVTADMTLYAKWIPSPVGGMFLMTVDLNGGTTSFPTTEQIPAGATLYFAENLADKVTPPVGKVFAGIEVDGVPYQFGTGYTVTQNFTLKLLWKDAAAPTYTVSFNANGGTGAMADVTGVSGEYTLPANGFTAPAGKQFKGWSVNGTEKAAGDKITVTADTTVTAVWQAIPAVNPPQTPTQTPAQSPVTGDGSMVGLWAALLLTSGAGAAAMVRTRRKQEDEE